MRDGLGRRRGAGASKRPHRSSTALRPRPLAFVAILAAGAAASEAREGDRQQPTELRGGRDGVGGQGGRWDGRGGRRRRRRREAILAAFQSTGKARVGIFGLKSAAGTGGSAVPPEIDKSTVSSSRPPLLLLLTRRPPERGSSSSPTAGLASLHQSGALGAARGIARDILGSFQHLLPVS